MSNKINRMLSKKIKMESGWKSRGLEEKFLCDPKADLFVSCGRSILPLHRCLVGSQGYFQERGRVRVHSIEEQLDVEMIQQVFGLFYGFDLELGTMKELERCVEIMAFFGMEELVEAMQAQVGEQLPDLDMFQVLELSFKYGLHKTFSLCFQYLECEEFEQINYNKFDLLKCGFTLFQLVLRRHHILKINGQIYGLSPDSIEEVIKSYCIQNSFDHATVSRLLEKYVKSLKTHYLHKGSLRLDKLEYKQVLESAILESKEEEPEQEPCKEEALERQDTADRKSKEEEKKEKKKKTEKGGRADKKRRMSCQLERAPEREVQWFRFGYEGGSKFEREESHPKIIPEERDDMKDEGQSEMMVNTSGSVQDCRAGLKNSIRSQPANSFGDFEDEDPESFLGKVSTLLDHYNEVFEQHQVKFNAIKDNVKHNAKSMIFNDLPPTEVGTELVKTTRFPTSTKFAAFQGIL